MPFADALYAMDRKWWDAYLLDVKEKFSGERWSSAVVAGVNRARIIPCGNSGAGAISLAASFGARRVILLGYDCQYTDGKRHWHGDHPPGLCGNAGSLPKWPRQFSDVSKRLRGVEVLNATRQTALTVFPRVTLEEVLHDRSGHH